MYVFLKILVNVVLPVTKHPAILAGILCFKWYSIFYLRLVIFPSVLIE
jgi:hypothetical protein